ncbi:hypothetical protein D3870_08005 [Noviherbaspirillum cavernae]|uniref:Uncharacterized protein n=1 Tax=Noviherbaspirillum cavernae TaxID=2320862 RepID=A0A418X0F8_9BURK|nr:hypothetical protein [Noviherbaspirillum cavernae]RJG05970.1 hypothetical protein D3870_08005 [Noviherbaspirillum cavernae]
MKIDRKTGADAISESARAIAMEHGILLSECVWDLGQDFRLEHAHRLDLVTATKSVRLYFPDLELTTSGNEHREKRTRDRLHRAISQLISRPPTATYTYR